MPGPIGGVLGSIGGAYIGGPVGAQIGGAAGSFLGNTLFGDNKKNPAKQAQQGIVPLDVLRDPFGTGRTDFGAATSAVRGFNFSTPIDFSAGGFRAELAGPGTGRSSGDSPAILGYRDPQFFDPLRAATNQQSNFLRAQAEKFRLGALTEARLTELENARTSAISTLRERHARNRLSGSSFATRDIASVDLMFAQEKAKTRAESVLQELDIQTQLIREANQIQIDRVKAEIEVAISDTALVANLTNAYNGIVAGNERLKLSALADTSRTQISAQVSDVNSLRAALVGQQSLKLGSAKLLAEGQAAQSEQEGRLTNVLTSGIGQIFGGGGDIFGSSGTPAHDPFNPPVDLF